MKQLALAENSTSVSDLLTVSEAAEYLRISFMDASNWVSDKKIVHQKLVVLFVSGRPTPTRLSGAIFTERMLNPTREQQES
jgi:hypothetical protein